MFQVNVYVINFYCTPGCKKTFNYVKNETKWKVNFQTNLTMFPLKMIYFLSSNKYFVEEPCFYQIFNFNLLAVEICFIRSWPVLLLIQSRKECRGKTQWPIYYWLLVLCIYLHLRAGNVKHTHIHKTRSVQFIMQFRSMQYRYNYMKNKAIGKQVQYLCYPWICRIHIIWV